MYVVRNTRGLAIMPDVTGHRGALATVVGNTASRPESLREIAQLLIDEARSIEIAADARPITYARQWNVAEMIEGIGSKS